MAEYLQYTTKEGARWCDVAQECYGTQTLNINDVNRSSMSLIIEDNPEVPIYDILPAGTILNIRIIPRVEVKTNAESLPPWKTV